MGIDYGGSGVGWGGETVVVSSGGVGGGWWDGSGGVGGNLITYMSNKSIKLIWSSVFLDVKAKSIYTSSQINTSKQY